MPSNKNKEKSKKTVCPNCGGDKFMPVYEGTEKVKGQTKCTGCSYVITEE